METPKSVRERRPDDRGEPGSEGESDAARKTPAAPSGDELSRVGATDQHSSSDS